MKLSVVVVAYNIARELPRTLLSLSPSYQRAINVSDFEVIVVDNGSHPPVEPMMIEGLGRNFRLIRIAEASPSPAAAINRGIAEAKADVIGVMVDGARIVTPGLLYFALHGAHLFKTSIVGALGWYLGYDYQRWDILAGYDHVEEDALLASIDWPQDGYRLFEISTMDESSVDGWLAPIAELNALFLHRTTWNLLGGFDERFDLPGGGLVNLDTFRRALELPQSQLVLLLGEATFHQLHGGVATNIPPSEMDRNWAKWAGQYEQIRGRPYTVPSPTNPTVYIGTLPRPALARFVRAAIQPASLHSGEAPLGESFDLSLWSAKVPPKASDPLVAQLVDLAQREFRAERYAATAAVSRLIRKRAPDEPEAKRLLALVAPWLATGAAPSPPSENYFLALGDAHRLLEENEKATANYRAALAINRDLVRAHIGLATMRLPGEFYYHWLDRFYTILNPEVVIEIGTADGQSLAYLRPSTVAIGVDPDPKPLVPLKVKPHIFRETSDEFFANQRPVPFLAGKSLGIGFIDGLHLFEQALRDFINLEKYCGARSVILLHDTMPLDEATQSRATDTQFHTGDVWKVVICLKHYRPDLDIFTIATPWTGLTVITGLDPLADQLADHYDEAVARFIDMPFSEIENCMETALNVVPNHWIGVESRLKVRNILT